MNPFTLAYLARIELWGLAAALLQGGLVWLSWLAWERAGANAPAALRHRLACAHFAAVAMLPILTVAILHWSIVEVAATPARGAVAHASLFMAGYRDAARLALPLAVIWLAGAGAMILRLGLDGWRIARLPRQPAPSALVESVRQLARGWAVPEVQAADIPAPQVVGLRRPVLLAPPDLMQRLPTAEREAVLLHELAHVRRGDFGWNLVQRLVLAMLWFHPAAWRLYAHLSREREVCCDAMAVGKGATAAVLARALVRLAEGPAPGGLAIAMSGRGELTARVQRLLGPRQSGPRPGRLAAAAAASGLCLIAVGFGRLGPGDPALGELCTASAFGPTISIMAHDPAGSFALRVRHGRVIEASVDRRPLPADHILQRGDRVTLVGARRQPILALTVAPHGAISWQARG